VRRTAAILVCLMLLLAVGVAYNQCSQNQCSGQNCPSPCPGNCPQGSCATCPNANQNCPLKTDCKTCRHDGTCSAKDSDKVTTASGAVRYVRGGNNAVKVMSAGKGLLLRIYPKCGMGDVLKQKLSALKKGEQVSANYWTCPKSGRHYLVDISVGAASAAAPTATGCSAAGSCPMGGGCGGQ
jgi:hypothetical protein